MMGKKLTTEMYKNILIILIVSTYLKPKWRLL